MPITIDRVRGDLLEVTADAIVNPWHRNILPRWLQVSGGISGRLKQVEIRRQTGIDITQTTGARR